MMNRLAAVMLLLGLTMVQTGYAIDAKGLFDTSRASVVLVMSFDKSGQPLAIGSGFFVADGNNLVTNHHVIEGATTVKIKSANGETLSIERVVGFDESHDLVLLQSPSKGLPLVLSEAVPSIGEEIIAIGNPQGLEGTLSLGVVSGIRENDGDTYYQITAPISPGSSGGPVIATDGSVIGVSTFYFDGGQNLNFSVPARYVSMMLENQIDKTIPEIAGSKTQTAIRSKANDGVRVSGVELGYNSFEGSVVNRTNKTIKNARLVVTFHRALVAPGKYCNANSAKGDVLHYMYIQVNKPVPPNLGQRFERNDRVLILKSLNWCAVTRVLDYEIVDESPSSPSKMPTFN